MNDVHPFIAQISDLQYGVCARVRVCVCACAIENKPGMLRAACFLCANGLPYKMAAFHSKKGLFNTVYTIKLTCLHF